MAISAAIDKPQLVPRVVNNDLLESEYLRALGLIERLHRLLLDVIKDDFEASSGTDINSVQALILFNIGDKELTAGDLRSRGYYQGSNVSYNLKKLVDMGYVSHKRCDVDRRSVRIRLTEKGADVHRRVGELFDRQARAMREYGVLDVEALSDTNVVMKGLEDYWRDQIRYIY